MGDVSGCQPSRNNLAVYLQGVTVTPSSTITSEYFVTASLPSSASLRRVWQFTTQGNISGTSTLTLDYTEANKNCPEYNITFEDALNGTLIIHNQTFSANKYVSYALSPTNPYVLVLTITIPKKIIECYGVGSTQPYFLNVNINDAATTTTCSFTTAGTYTASFSNTSSSVQTVDYICVGGGGGGQDGNGGYAKTCFTGDAAGGGGGTVETGTFCINANSTVLCSITVGSGGSHGSSGGAGGSTSLDTSGAVMDISIDVSGGCGGANGVGGDSGAAVGGTSSTCQGGYYCAGGGGAGGGENDGVSGTCPNDGSNGGNGGDGYTWDINEITYGGGGGGAGLVLGLGGSGGGGYGSGGTISGQNGSTGGGGGAGAGNSNNANNTDGGNGGDGVVLFSWTSSNITGCPS